MIARNSAVPLYGTILYLFYHFYSDLLLLTVVGTCNLKVIRYRYSVLSNHFKKYRITLAVLGTFFSTLVKSKIPIFVLACKKSQSAMSVRILVKGCDFKDLQKFFKYYKKKKTIIIIQNK